MGPTETATRAQIAASPNVGRWPAIEAAAIAVAQAIDNPEKNGAAVAVNTRALKEHVQAIDPPDRRRKSGGRLASIKVMTGNPHPAQQRKEA